MPTAITLYFTTLKRIDRVRPSSALGAECGVHATLQRRPAEVYGVKPPTRVQHKQRRATGPQEKQGFGPELIDKAQAQALESQ